MQAGLTVLTGAAGFIGSFVARKLLARGDSVLGIDNLNSYYDPRLKEARLAELRKFPNFVFERLDIADGAGLKRLAAEHPISRMIHLAAQAGVRYSVENPESYTHTNLVGFSNILELCRHARVEHFVFASSSSVYGTNSKLPYSVHDTATHPMSYYAATKLANEAMAHSYAHLYRVPTTGLRFFTVYGPWGRPDMALFSFTRAILEGRPITLYNDGNMQRDFTYVEDVAECVVRILDKPAQPDPHWCGEAPDQATSAAPYRIYNVGNHQPVELRRFIEVLEKCLGRKAERRYLPLQPGDVPATFANVDDLIAAIGFKPETSIETGIETFVRWYKDFYPQHCGAGFQPAD